MSREPQPEKGTILLICFEAMFERMSLFSCPDRKISSEEKGISSEEIAINVQLYPISSEDIPENKYIYLLLHLPRVRAHVKKFSILGQE